MTLDISRTAISVLELRECVDDPPFTIPEVRTVIERMDRGGYSIHTLSSTELGGRAIYSVIFRKGDEEIHVTGQTDVRQLYEAALKEAHRRYRARMSTPLPGAEGLGGKLGADGASSMV